MHLINADVLPSFLEDDEIEAQVVAYALDVHYYEDEGAFAATVPECESVKCENLNGYKILPAMGSVLPNGFLRGNIVKMDNGTGEHDESDDELVTIFYLLHLQQDKSIFLHFHIFYVNRYFQNIPQNFSPLL